MFCQEGGLAAATVSPRQTARQRSEITAHPVGSEAADAQWQPLTTGKLMAAAIERALFAREQSSRFFIHVRITNLSQRAAGVDLSDSWEIVYPNQWGVYQRDHREEIDEERRAHEPLSEPRKMQLIADYHANKLTMMAPGQTMDYYREFNASGRTDVDQSQGRYVILSLDGRILVTDGKDAEALDCTGTPSDAACGDVVIPFPVAWKTIPPGR